jgi:hypothetical protein
MITPARPQPTPQGTRRRLQALMNRGWSPQAIQAATGIPAARITAAVTGRRQPALALDDHQVAAAYDRLWQRPPPQATPRERKQAAAARDTAERHKWPPPMAWDDDLIDQPDARPAPGWARTGTSHRSADLAADLAWIREQGGYRHASIDAAAARLGVKPNTLGQACLRAARTPARQPDLELEAG